MGYNPGPMRRRTWGFLYTSRDPRWPLKVPPTPEQPPLLRANSNGLQTAGWFANPAVLRSPQSACCQGNNPFEPPADHERYNTLDFPQKVVCQPGVPHPIGCPGPKGACAPLWKPAGFKLCIYKLKKGVCVFRSQNTIPVPESPASCKFTFDMIELKQMFTGFSGFRSCREYHAPA